MVGHQISKQPDGKLAIFSDGVDGGCWLRWDMTPDEVVEYYAERAAQNARESVWRTVNHIVNDEPRKAYYQFYEPFAVLNATSKYNGHDVLDGPVDRKTLDDLVSADAEFDLGMGGHLMHGSDYDAS
jgi:hypothetical protein